MAMLIRVGLLTKTEKCRLGLMDNLLHSEVCSKRTMKCKQVPTDVLCVCTNKAVRLAIILEICATCGKQSSRILTSCGYHADVLQKKCYNH